MFCFIFWIIAYRFTDFNFTEKNHFKCEIVSLLFSCSHLPISRKNPGKDVYSPFKIWPNADVFQTSELGCYKAKDSGPDTSKCHELHQVIFNFIWSSFMNIITCLMIHSFPNDGQLHRFKIFKSLWFPFILYPYPFEQVSCIFGRRTVAFARHPMICISILWFYHWSD